MPQIHRCLAGGLSLIFAVGSAGCTGLGAAIGGMVPRMTELPPEYRPKTGESVVVVTTAGADMYGRFVREDAQQIVVRVEREDGDWNPGDVSVMRSDIDAFKVPRGNHAATGALVGLGLDLAVIVAYVAVGAAFSDAFDDSDNHH